MNWLLQPFPEVPALALGQSQGNDANVDPGGDHVEKPNPDRGSSVEMKSREERSTKGFSVRALQGICAAEHPKPGDPTDGSSTHPRGHRTPRN